MRRRHVLAAAVAASLGLLAVVAALAAGLPGVSAAVLGSLVAVLVAGLAGVLLQVRQSERALQRQGNAVRVSQLRLDRRTKRNARMLRRLVAAMEEADAEPADPDAPDPFPAIVEVPARIVRWPEELTGEQSRLALRITGVDELRRCAALAAGQALVSELVVELRAWAPPSPGWAGRLGPLAELREHSVRWDLAAGELQARLLTAHDVDLGQALRAVLAAAAPQRRRPSSSGPDVAIAVPVPLGAVSLLSWDTEVILPDDVVDGHVRRTDLLVVDESAPHADIEAGDRVVVAQSQWGDVVLGGGDLRAVVDPSVCRPTGRRGVAAGAATRLVARDGELLLVGDDDTVHAQARRTPFEAAAVQDLLAVDTCLVPADLCNQSSVGALVQLSACGVIVSVEPGAGNAPGVAPDLVALWAVPLPTAGDDLAMLTASVAQRRAALRSHALLAERLPAPPTVSVLLVSKRPENLAAVLAQVASSTYPNLQVVVGLHGSAPDAPAVRDAVAASGLADVVVLSAPTATPFGSVLGAVTARAEGDLVTKIDDDDVYGPEHVWDLVLAREYSGAELVGKPPVFTYVEQLDRTIWRDGGTVEGYGTFVAGGTMLVARADLEAVGGWRPVLRSVDRGLLQRVLRAGGLVYSTHGLGYLYARHESGHTWDVGADHFRDAPRRQEWPGRLQHPEFGNVPTQSG